MSRAPERELARVRTATGDPAGAQQRDHHRAGHEPIEVEGRVDREDDDDGDHCQQPDPLWRAGRGAHAERTCGAQRGGPPRASEQQAESETHEAEVAERLEDVAVRLCHGQRARVVARVRRRIAAGALADERGRFPGVDRVAPVDRALAAERRQSGGAVRNRDVRIGQRAHVVRDRAEQSARACGEADDRDDRDECDAARAARGRSARATRLTADCAARRSARAVRRRCSR